jgi:hypothetical protein
VAEQLIGVSARRLWFDAQRAHVGVENRDAVGNEIVARKVTNQGLRVLSVAEPSGFSGSSGIFLYSTEDSLRTFM